MDIYIYLVIIFVVTGFGLVVRRNKAIQQYTNKQDNYLISAPKSYKIVSLALLTCHIVGTIAGYHFSSNDSEDTLIIIILVMVPLFICISFLAIWFNIKQVRIMNKTIIYINIIGQRKEYHICDLSYSLKGEGIIIFSGKKRVFRLNFLWKNIDKLLDIIEVN